MSLEIIPKEEMAIGRKKEKEKKEKEMEKSITRVDKADIDIKVDKERESDKKRIVPPTSPNVVIKRIYFPEDVYSNNQSGFKKILANFDLSWSKYYMKSYISKQGKKVLTGVYASSDQQKKIFMIYEGTNKPAHAIIKLIGTGGKFLIELISFANKVGCIIEDKDENFINNTMLTLQEKGEIYVEKKFEMGEYEDFEKKFEAKVEKLLQNTLERYIEAYKDILKIRGVSEETFKLFKKKEIEKDIRWGLEHGYLKVD